MAADLKEAGIRVPSFYEDALFCPVGETPLYLGQPLALLIFERFDAFDQARLALRDLPCATYGAETGPLRRDPYGAYRFVRVAGERPDGPDVYSPLQEGWIVPRRFKKDDTPVWMAAQQQGESGAKARFYAERIRAELAAGNPDLLVLDRTFETQSIDPMFLEPEAGLGWYDADKKSLELVIGVQSPQEATELVAYCFGEARGGLKPAHIHTHFAYLGGGFGGRDHTPFPLYVALAAMFFPSRPVRLAHSRFDQFQSGIKRHAFRMRTRISVDRKSGRIQAFAADHVLDGGGSANYSASVATVGATAAIGIYDIPKVDVTTVAIHSRGVPAGSMRGFGTTQTMTALEVLIDEAAKTLGIDPIDFRRRNALPTGGRTMVGNPLDGITRTVEISRPARSPSDLAGARSGEGPRAAGVPRRDGCCLRHQELRQRRRLHAMRSDGLARGPHRHPLGRGRNGHGYRHGARQPRRRRGRRGLRFGVARRHRRLQPPRTRHVGRPLQHGASGPGRSREGPALGSRHQRTVKRIHRRSCQHPRRKRGRPRYLPLRPVARRPRPVEGSPNRPACPAMG